MKRFFLILSLVAFGLILTGCKTVPRVAVMGDSYSAFKGWIPAEYDAYYPCNEVDVKNAEQCWWYLLAEKMGGKLEKIDAYSGSTICNTGYQNSDFTYRSFVTRAPRLGNPTHIFICGATNDSWANSPIGEYKWENWTREELFSFRPAFAKLLNDLHTLYPKAQVVFLLNHDLKAEINDSVHEICAHYHVPCVDLKNIDKMQGHPSAMGMQQICDQVFPVVEL